VFVFVFVIFHALSCRHACHVFSPPHPHLLLLPLLLLLPPLLLLLLLLLLLILLLLTGGYFVLLDISSTPNRPDSPIPSECCARIICVLLYSHTPKIPDSLLSRINVKVSGLCETDEEQNVLLRARGGAEEGSRADEVREQCVGVKLAT
jgi:hypothetical protein